jgi:transposase
VVDVARSAVAIELSEADEAALRGVVRARSSTQQQALRARIVLRAAEGATNRQIAAETGASLPTVGLWRTNFAAQGRAGLVDRARSGRPRTVDEGQVQRILAKTLEPPPDGTTHWSVRRLAQVTGVSPTTVHRIWCGHRLKPIDPSQTPPEARSATRRAPGATSSASTDFRAAAESCSWTGP